ncbi:MAG: hypothetical protein NC548_53355 [Lachnospiraceae bacterium]|nr:hypothetical protein [Lachnospiraceae bacterium]
MSINCCPYCGNINIVLQEKGYSVGKGLLGIATFGLLGGLAGLHGSKRLQWRCANCGHTFAEPALKSDEPVLTDEQLQAILALGIPKEQPQRPAPVKSAPPVVKQRLLCTCGAYNSIYNNACFSCGAPLSLATSTKVPAMPNKTVVCQCGIKNSLENKYCAGCGQQLDYSTLPQVDGQPSFTQADCPVCGQPTPQKSRKIRFCTHCGKEL